MILMSLIFGAQKTFIINAENFLRKQLYQQTIVDRLKKKRKITMYIQYMNML